MCCYNRLVGLLRQTQTEYGVDSTGISVEQQLLPFLETLMLLTHYSTETRFTKLNAGEGDVLWRNTTITFSRDVSVKLDFWA